MAIFCQCFCQTIFNKRSSNKEESKLAHTKLVHVILLRNIKNQLTMSWGMLNFHSKTRGKANFSLKVAKLSETFVCLSNSGGLPENSLKLIQLCKSASEEESSFKFIKYLQLGARQPSNIAALIRKRQNYVYFAELIKCSVLQSCIDIMFFCVKLQQNRIEPALILLKVL